MATAVVMRYRATVLILKRPMVERSSKELTPVTKDTNTKVTISILIPRMNKSPMGLRAVATSGIPAILSATPTTSPAMRAINICFQRASRRHPLKGPRMGFCSTIQPPKQMYLLSCSIGLLVISAFILVQNASDSILVKTLKGEEAKTLKGRSEEHTSELQSRGHLVCRL